MDSNKSKRVVVYCRVATQAQLDGDHTLEAQSARLHEQAWVMKLWEKSASMKKELRLTATAGKGLVRRRWSKRRTSSLLPILHG